MTHMLFSGALGKMIHEKNPKQKISWHFPFKTPAKKCDSSNITKHCLGAVWAAFSTKWDYCTVPWRSLYPQEISNGIRELFWERKTTRESGVVTGYKITYTTVVSMNDIQLLYSYVLVVFFHSELKLGIYSLGQLTLCKDAPKSDHETVKSNQVTPVVIWHNSID